MVGHRLGRRSGRRRRGPRRSHGQVIKSSSRVRLNRLHARRNHVLEHPSCAFTGHTHGTAAAQTVVDNGTSYGLQMTSTATPLRRRRVLTPAPRYISTPTHRDARATL